MQNKLRNRKKKNPPLLTTIDVFCIIHGFLLAEHGELLNTDNLSILTTDQVY